MGLIDLTSNLAVGAGTNFSSQGGRHGGTEAGGLPVHPAIHSSLDGVSSLGGTPVKLGWDVFNLSPLSGRHTDGTNTINVSTHGGRHGGTEIGGLPIHPLGHSAFDSLDTPATTPIKLGKDVANLSSYGGRHGGVLVDGALTPHLAGHSLLDGPNTPATTPIKIGTSVTNLSALSGRHGGTTQGGLPVHPAGHSAFDVVLPMPATPEKISITLGKPATPSPIFNSTTFTAREPYGETSRLVDIHSNKFLDTKYDRMLNQADALSIRPDKLGFDQPYVVKDINDRWGLDFMGDADLGIVRGGLNTAIARTVADEIRLAKFILTPRGLLFGIKQSVLQRFNTKAETRI